MSSAGVEDREIVCVTDWHEMDEGRLVKAIQYSVIFYVALPVGLYIPRGFWSVVTD